MLKKILLACLLFPFFTGAHADEKPYSSPQKINCLLKDNQPVCEYDATYLGFQIDSESVRDMLGTYHFDHAESYNMHMMDDDYAKVTYVYINEKNVTAYADSIYQILRTDSPAWVPMNGRSESFICTSSDIRNCTFTHTPWHEELGMTAGNVAAPSKKNMHNTRYYKITKTDTNVAIDNRTDFPVSIGVGDNNTASLQLLTQTIPTHNKMKIMQNVNIADANSLIFTLQVGSGLRNTNNTTVIHRKSTGWTGIYAVGHTINHQVVYVAWCASPDRDTSVFRVSYKDMCAE